MKKDSGMAGNASLPSQPILFRPGFVSFRSTLPDMLPGAVLFAFFIWEPLLEAVRLSLYEAKGMTTIRFVGLDNYRRILKIEPDFWPDFLLPASAALARCGHLRLCKLPCVQACFLCLATFLNRMHPADFVSSLKAALPLSDCQKTLGGVGGPAGPSTLHRKLATCAAIFARFCLQNRFLTRANGREGCLQPDQ